MTYRFSWHYIVIIFPLILYGATYATFGYFENLIAHKVLYSPGILTPPITVYLWIRFLTVPFKFQIMDKDTILARSIASEFEIPISRIAEVSEHHFSYKLHIEEKSVLISNLMHNSNQLAAYISNRISSNKRDQT